MAEPRGPDPQPLVPRLRVERLSKTFGRRRVLNEVSIAIQSGELHAVIGRNGSGKSTLVKVLSDYHRPDRGGVVEIDGAVVPERGRLVALREAGVSVVHQSLGLLDERTVVENVLVGGLGSTSLHRIRSAEEERRVARTLARLQRELPLRAAVGGLSAEERATVAVARALHDQIPGRGLILFDESTRALHTEALERFYEQIALTRSAGAAVLLVCHRLDEVLTAADRITVLRDGAVVASGVPASQTTHRELVRLMVGRDVVSPVRRRSPAARARKDRETIAVRNLTAASVRDVSFEIFPGEILGATGLVGSGHDELPYLLAGERPAARGTIHIGDQPLDLAERARRWRYDGGRKLIQACLSRGIALVPERREEVGLALDLSVRENLTVPRVNEKGRTFWAGRRWQDEEFARIASMLDLQPPLADIPVATLSGGNQQKVLLGRWLAGEPRLLILHEPTQAVDVAAYADIATAIRDAADRGAAVLLASGDPRELAQVCDRVLVFRDGVVDSVLAGELDEDELVNATLAGEGSRT